MYPPLLPLFPPRRCGEIPIWMVPQCSAAYPKKSATSGSTSKGDSVRKQLEVANGKGYKVKFYWSNLRKLATSGDLTINCGEPNKYYKGV